MTSTLINPHVFSLTGNDLYTTVLLHMDGADAGTTFTDSNFGGSAHTWTAAGNAQIDTADSKFGGASGLFDGSGDYVTTPAHADWDFGSGAFTVDLWMKVSGGSGDRSIIGDYNAGGSSLSFLVGINSSHVGFGRAKIGGTTHTLTGTTNISSGWHHIAFVREGDTLKLYVDGTQEDSEACSGALSTPVDVLGIGRPGAGNFWYFTGWIDEIRISKGIARWTANFTPPTAAYA
jgi:hypothetical protein